MKNETQIRQELEAIERLYQAERKGSTKPYLLAGALAAIRWVLEEPITKDRGPSDAVSETYKLVAGIVDDWSKEKPDAHQGRTP